MLAAGVACPRPRAGHAATTIEAYSLMVKRTAHNGDIVGSSPTKPIVSYV
jgi:hypothetical protein